MKHVRQCGLVKEDMKRIVDLVGIDFIKEIINKSEYEDVYASKYSMEITRENALYFLKYHLDSIDRKLLKKFYRRLNEKIVIIEEKLLDFDDYYEAILNSKKLIELRNLFEKSELDREELKAIPILLKCKDIEYTNSIAFTIENELYVRKRIDNRDKKKSDHSQDYVNKINQLMQDLKENELTINEKNEKISLLEKRVNNLELEVYNQNMDIGYYPELTDSDYVKIIQDLGKHSSKIKEKFKNLIEKFENSPNKQEYKLYEVWMEWTDDEVTIMDDILKKSMYQEVIKQNDLRDLESVSENIMNRYLLSRLLLHFIYRRMSSQCWEEVLG